MRTDIEKVSDKVKRILSEYPQTRDSDKELWLAYNVLYNNLKNSLGDYNSFKKWLKQGTTPMFESLSRARRKIQEENPELGGAHRTDRMIESESVSEWAVGR